MVAFLLAQTKPHHGPASVKTQIKGLSRYVTQPGVASFVIPVQVAASPSQILQLVLVDKEGMLFVSVVMVPHSNISAKQINTVRLMGCAMPNVQRLQ